MSKFALTPQGVADKLTELYALPDSVLMLQAAAISVDFRWWLRQNFELDPLQDIYLSGMNSGAVIYYGQQCSTCFLNRLPISLVYPVPSAPGFGKWVELSSSIQMTSNGDGEIQVTGSLVFKMTYRSKKREL